MPGGAARATARRPLATWHERVVVNKAAPHGNLTSAVTLDRWYPIWKATRRPSGHWTRVSYPTARTVVTVTYPQWEPQPTPTPIVTPCQMASWFGQAVVRYSWIVCADHGEFAVNLIGAVIYTESSGNPSITSPAGAIGLMQLEPATACRFGYCSIAGLYTPTYNIAAGVAVLTYYTNLYAGNIVDGLEAYNCGYAPAAGSCSSYALLVIARARGQRLQG